MRVGLGMNKFGGVLSVVQRKCVIVVPNNQGDEVRPGEACGAAPLYRRRHPWSGGRSIRHRYRHILIVLRGVVRLLVLVLDVVREQCGILTGLYLGRRNTVLGA